MIKQIQWKKLFPRFIGAFRAFSRRGSRKIMSVFWLSYAIMSRFSPNEALLMSFCLYLQLFLLILHSRIIEFTNAKTASVEDLPYILVNTFICHKLLEYKILALNFNTQMKCKNLTDCLQTTAFKLYISSRKYSTRKFETLFESHRNQKRKKKERLLPFGETSPHDLPAPRSTN